MQFIPLYFINFYRALKLTWNLYTFSSLSNEESITSALLTALEKASESAEALDLGALTTYIAFDCVCEAAFGYSLGAVAGSEEGKCLHLSLCSLVDAQAGKGMYANPNARKVSPEELVKAQATWRNFLTKLLAVIRSDSEQFRAKNGVLDTERNFGHALIQLSVSEEAYGDAQLISEIHQVQSHFNSFCLCFFSSPAMSSSTRCFRTYMCMSICVCALHTLISCMCPNSLYLTPITLHSARSPLHLHFVCSCMAGVASRLWNHCGHAVLDVLRALPPP